MTFICMLITQQKAEFNTAYMTFITPLRTIVWFEIVIGGISAERAAGEPGFLSSLAPEDTEKYQK